MKRFLILLLVFMIAAPVVGFAGRYRRSSAPSVTNITQEVKGEDRNFYVPLSAEVNVTPQRFRTDWFQGVFSTSGVEVGGHEPVFFTGALARFDLFPERNESEV